MAFRIASVLGLAAALVACSASSEHQAANPSRGQSAQVQPASSDALMAYEACVKRSKDEPADGHAACRVTKEDCEVLNEIDSLNDAKFGPLDLGFLAVLPTQLSIMGSSPGASGFAPVCDQDVCRIPVIVKPDPSNRCQATLPYIRYCVRPKTDRSKPQRLVFYLASVVNNKLVAMTTADGFEFVDPPRHGPPPYDSADVLGLDLHEDVRAGVRRPMQKNYFELQGRSGNGLEFTWKVTASTLNTVGNIGRIHDGVLSAAFVRPTGSTDAKDICRPRDPIIVNTAN